MHDVADGALCRSLPPGTFTSLVSGTQSVSKGRQGPQAVNNVQVNLKKHKEPAADVRILTSGVLEEAFHTAIRHMSTIEPRLYWLLAPQDATQTSS